MKITIIFAFIWMTGSPFAQNSDIIGTWDLWGMRPDLGAEFLVESVDPPINPSLTIYEDFSFEGLGACNSFSGNFVFDTQTGTLQTKNYSQTNINCDHQSHWSFEGWYFVYFLAEVPLDNEFAIHETHGFEFFKLGVFDTAGYMIFRNSSLAVPSSNRHVFHIYPNPTSDWLLIKSDSHLDKVVIYNLNGQKTFSELDPREAIDVSNLPRDIYFLEIISEGKRHIQKFIKN